MMKFLKKLFLFCLIGFCVSFFACENTNDIRCASFTNITQPGSDKSEIRVVYEQDERINEKYVDIQIKSSKPIQLSFNKENEEKLTINFKNTAYNSLETLIVEAQDMAGHEDFKKYKEMQSETLIFSSDEDVVLTFKVVVGEKTENSTRTGYILANSKEISNEFKLKLSKK